MTRKLSTYPNCSMGGMATVLRSRAVGQPEVRHDLFFSKEAGGSGSFDRIENVTVRVVSKGRLGASLAFATANIEYDEVSITSSPSLVKSVAPSVDSRVVYEVHTSTAEVIASELAAVREHLRGRIRVPSEFTAWQVRTLSPAGFTPEIEVVPNEVDRRIFRPGEPASGLIREGSSIPLVWVGRLDKGKNPNDLIRLLSQLPREYYTIVVLSLEDDPVRMEKFIGLAAHYGVDDRVDFRLNISQAEMADLFRAARERGGYLVSTSLAESFGYSVLEADLCGLRSLAYGVGALPEHAGRTRDLALFEVGDVGAICHHIIQG